MGYTTQLRSRYDRYKTEANSTGDPTKWITYASKDSYLSGSEAARIHRDKQAWGGWSTLEENTWPTGRVIRHVDSNRCHLRQIPIDRVNTYHGDDHGDSIITPVLFKLPTRKGQSRYVYGYEEDCSGYLCLAFDAPEADKGDASGYADWIARYAARKEREYQRRCEVAFDYDQLGDEAKDELRQISMIRKARRDTPVDNTVLSQTIQNTLTCLKESVLDKLARRREIREELPDVNQYL